jgi:lipopolysaccharide transport system ATP-binding protein
MADIMIKAENLGKLYRIGAQQARYRTLRETLVNSVVTPLRRMRAKFQPSSIQHSKDFIWALKNVSFEVKQGEVIGIIGRNGAGKSTLLKILSHITEPTEGRVALRGRVGSLLEVGSGFHPELTGRENIYLNGAILGMRRVEIDRKFDEIVAFSEIENYLDTPVKRYSSGMSMRLAFAVAAHLEPDILLVDEVLAVGDVEFQKKCLGKMGDVVKEGRTVLFVSHNMTAIQNLCQRGILINKGQVYEDGNVSDVIGKYLSINNEYNKFCPELGLRSGNYLAKIENFWISPKHPQTGKPVEFHFEISRPKVSNTELVAELAVSFLTEINAPVFQLFSRHMGKEFIIKPGITHLKVKVENLLLTPGNYHINLWLGNGNNPIDWIQDCFILNVRSGFISKSEFVESRGYPIIQVATWSME